MGYIIGYFVLLPALRKKLGGKSEKENMLVFDNFLYAENDARELSSDTKEPAVLTVRRFIKFSEYAFLVNFILLLIFLNIS
jgi:hypothetical protein